MRLTSEFWVGALVRRVFGEGGFAAVVRRGATEAGAIFVTVRDRQGMVTLYGPAPQTSYVEGRPDDRRFSELMSAADEGDVTRRLDKEMRFDPDLWVLELEPGKTAPAELLEV